MAGLTVTAVTTTMPRVTDAGAPAQKPRRLSSKRGLGDRVFDRMTSISGLIVLVVMLAVGLFLAIEAKQALTKAGWSFFTIAEWETGTNHFGIAAILLGTVVVAVVAVVVAVPIALGTALFITEIAPTWLRSTLIALVDLMAAVPSVVYGLWGLFLLQGQIIGISRWLNTWFGWIPIFAVNGADPDNPLSSQTVYSASVFIAGLVVAMMVMPIACVVMRQVFSQVPVGEREGAYALGSTRWGMIRVVALPFARGGIIGGTMLGLGRALGETIAVALILSPRNLITLHILEAGGNTVSSHIATRYAEEQGFGLSALFAAGLVLFGVTLFINFTASWFISRSRSGASSEA